MSNVVTIPKQDIIKMDAINDPVKLKAYAQFLIESKLVPATFNTPEKLIIAILYGKELGMGAVTAMNNIYTVNGSPALSVHAIAGRMRDKGIKWIKSKEIEAVGDDKVTEITHFEMIGSHLITGKITFTKKEAEMQDLLKKENWKRMFPTMMQNRCLAKTGRFLGVITTMEISEAADFHNVDIKFDQEGMPIKEWEIK